MFVTTFSTLVSPTNSLTISSRRKSTSCFLISDSNISVISLSNT
ncbi:hypothetical protein H477_3065 [[Clostridium] sordellii ATCC 9714]|nr:hypothetical protein H477_3065 [[Clostridium] sordellii ATCC 9714] [Paeniclostridium sordellii ATCC 9714]